MWRDASRALLDRFDVTVLVTGSTGRLGRLVLQRLLTLGVDPDTIIAGARTPAGAEGLAILGVQVRRLDYDDPATVRDALRGTHRVLLISGEEPGRRVIQHQTVIDAAANSDVELFAYTSLLHSSTNPLTLATDHVQTERAITAAGLPAVILRNNWYTENFVFDLRQAARSGVIEAAAGTGTVASATRADYADAAAAVLTSSGHVGATYELAGDTSWNYSQLADVASELFDRPITYRPQRPQDRLAALTASGMKEETAKFFWHLELGIAGGALDSDDHTLSHLIGRPTTSLLDGLRNALLK